MPKTSDFVIGIAHENVQTAIFISEALENVGFRTFQAYTGKDALGKYWKEKASIVIMGSHFPDMDANELAEEFEKSKVILTAGLDSVANIKVKNIIGKFPKPIDMNSVIDLIKKTLKVS